MGASQRRKGHDFERWVARQLGTRRGYQYRDGADAPDVMLDGWHLECKRGKRPSPRAALAQAQRDAKPGRLIAAVIRDDRAEPFVCMPWDDWRELVETVRELQAR